MPLPATTMLMVRGHVALDASSSRLVVLWHLADLVALAKLAQALVKVAVNMARTELISLLLVLQGPLKMMAQRHQHLPLSETFQELWETVWGT